MKLGVRARFILGGIGTIVVLLIFWAVWHVAKLGVPWGRLLQFWYVFGLFLIFIILPLWFCLNRWVFRPLDRLTLADLRAAQGDMQGAIIPGEAIPEDEIGHVMRARNEMLDALLGRGAELEEQVRRRTFELRVAHEISERVGYTLRYEEMIRLILERLHRALPHDVSAALLVRRDRDELFIRAARPLAPAIEEEIRERLTGTIARLGRRGEPTERRPDFQVLESGEFDPARPALARLGSLFLIPVTVEQEVAGVLFVGAEQEGAFMEDEVRVLYAVAEQASRSVERLRAVLAAEHRRILDLVGHLPEAVLLVDVGWRIVLANPAGQKELAALSDRGEGDMLTELGGQPLERLLRPLPDGRPREIVVEGPSPRVIEVESQAIIEGPEAGGWVLVLRDVTRERQLLAAEQARRREIEILYGLGQALARAHDRDDVLVVATDHAGLLLDFDAAAAFLLDPKEQFLTLGYARALPSALRAALKEMPVGPGVTGRAVTERRPVIMSIESVPEEGALSVAVAAAREAGFVTLVGIPFLAPGRVLGAMGLASRQRVKLSQEMMALLASVGTQIGMALANVAEKEQRLAQDRMAALGRLAAGVAHELRNPLTVIDGRLQLLQGQMARGEPLAGERLAKFVASLAEATERMRKIVLGLSIYSKPAKPQPEPLNVGELLAATRDLLAHEARKSGVTVTVEAPTALPPVLGDRSQLMEVLLNLATNAIEAMAATGGRLTLRAEVEGDGVAALVRVKVADTGPGIPPEALQKIWEAFYTTKPEGTGLGLSIVRGLVAQQPGGATIGVESSPGQGATFTLTMPVARATTPESQVA